MKQRICETCRYWSEMVATYSTEIEALCMSDVGHHSGKMTRRAHSCPAWADGVLGAIDTPDTDPESLAQSYAALDEAQQA